MSFPSTAPGSNVIYLTGYAAAWYITHFKYALSFGEAQDLGDCARITGKQEVIPADAIRAITSG
jgi:hypothetical protein